MKNKQIAKLIPSALLGLALACTAGFNAAVQAQDISGTNIVAFTDWDTAIPAWDYGYFYQWITSSNGTYTTDRFYDDSAHGGTLCERYTFDNSPYQTDILADPSAGYGTGFGGPQMSWGYDGSVFNTLVLDPTNYLFEFDARVEGLLPGMTQGNCEMQCQITGSGGNPKYLQKNYSISVGSNWTHYALTFEDGGYGDGTSWTSFTNNFANIVEVRWNANLHMPHPEFGFDSNNVVLVDNMQLGVRQFSSPPPPAPPVVPLTILDWNMDDKPIWYTYGGYNWSQNSYLPTFDYFHNDGPNTLGVGGSSGWWLSMTNSPLAAPNTPQWAGGGMGGGGPVDFSRFTDNDLNKYIVSFDARVAGLDGVTYPDVTNMTATMQLFMDSPGGNIRLDIPVQADSNWVHTAVSFNSANWDTGGGRVGKASFATNYNTYSNLRTQWQIDNATDAHWGYDADNMIILDNIKVVHNVVACPPLTITPMGNNEVISWTGPNTGTCKLQSASSVKGPWTDVLVAGNPATSPYTNAISSAPKYFRTAWIAP